MRTYLLICLLFLCVLSCNVKDNRLKKYYENNLKLHQELSDSLMSFSKRYKTDIVLHKTDFPNRNIQFDIHFHDSAAFIPVYFDSALNRHDYKPTLTEDYLIPKELIEKFKSSIYFGIGADSTFTFFAFKWNEPITIGTHGDSQHGILILKDSSQVEKSGKKISRNACITNYGIF